MAENFIFSKRVRIADAATKWCVDNGADQNPFNIVTALSAMGMLGEQNPTLTDEEREAIMVAAIELNTFHCSEEHHSHTLRGLLARCAIGHQ